jgi:hypothetical protein
VIEAAGAIGREVTEFSVGPSPDTGMAQGQHVFVVEFAGESPDVTRFAAALDAALRRRNDDYCAHRDGGQLLAPHVVAAPEGCFASWMKARGRLGGQNKVPRVIADPALLTSLLESAAVPASEV